MEKADIIIYLKKINKKLKEYQKKLRQNSVWCNLVIRIIIDKIVF